MQNCLFSRPTVGECILISLRQTLVVEGKYDKIKCSQIFDCNIIETNGFGIFKDKKIISMLRRLAKTDGLILLTDSDSAGFKIRNYIISSVGSEYVTNVYIPDLFGKERRKSELSKEGKLGVEGISDDIIVECFKKAGVFNDNKGIPKKNDITKTHLYLCGLSGSDDSAYKRKALLKHLDLPERLSTNSLVNVLNSLMSKEQLDDIIYKLFV